MAAWPPGANVKAQAADMLGIQLTDDDVGKVPLLRTDPYGNFIPDADGYAAGDHRRRPRRHSEYGGRHRHRRHRRLAPVGLGRAPSAPATLPRRHRAQCRAGRRSPTATSTIGLATIPAIDRRRLRQRTARRALHRRRRPRQREHRPDRRPPCVPRRAQPAGRPHQGGRAADARRCWPFINEWRRP